MKTLYFYDYIAQHYKTTSLPTPGTKNYWYYTSILSSLWMAKCICYYHKKFQKRKRIVDILLFVDLKKHILRNLPANYIFQK